LKLLTFKLCPKETLDLTKEETLTNVYLKKLKTKVSKSKTKQNDNEKKLANHKKYIRNLKRKKQG
jgi:hypothetical protein